MIQPIQLYTVATPNGRKVSIALEAMGLPYEAHCVDIGAGEQFTEEFVTKVNPNSKIPAIIDPDGPDGAEHRVFESGAILMYLAEKSGQLLSRDPAKRSETIQWLFFQNAGVGPMFGQFGHFYKFGKDNCDHPYPVERYTKEVKRLLGVLEQQLEGQEYLVGEYSIADISTFPWVGCLDWGYEAKEFLGLNEYPNVMAWHERNADKPASKKGAEVCGF
ncbi:MAG TPA: glutathione binding-like protein [Candidatus Paceibacterota bacterium]|nr:glutathione binding-like protein [Candidatus Paceibacterota bacterium]